MSVRRASDGHEPCAFAPQRPAEDAKARKHQNPSRRLGNSNDLPGNRLTNDRSDGWRIKSLAEKASDGTSREVGAAVSVARIETVGTGYGKRLQCSGQVGRVKGESKSRAADAQRVQGPKKLAERYRQAVSLSNKSAGTRHLSVEKCVHGAVILNAGWRIDARRIKIGDGRRSTDLELIIPRRIALRRARQSSRYRGTYYSDSHPVSPCCRRDADRNSGNSPAMPVPEWVERYEEG